MKKIILAGLWALVGCSAFAQKTIQDTAYIEVESSEAVFDFTGTDSATYCVDWGDGMVEKRYLAKGTTHGAFFHTYSSEDAHTIKFWGEQRGRVSSDSREEEYTETIADLNFSMEFVYVEGGTFMMGCEGEGCSDQSKPIHEVTLDGYYIGKFEVTQAQWNAIMGNTSNFNGDNLPIGNITWIEAKLFCDKLSQKTGRKYALPTEAQWEFAARGGIKSKGYEYSGSNTPSDVAWYAGDAHTVGSKVPNELGLYDMSGNVLEWCADWYGPYNSVAVTNPVGPNFGDRRVARGGSHFYASRACSVSYRSRFDPNSHISHIGLRIVCLDTNYDPAAVMIDTLSGTVYTETISNINFSMEMVGVQGGTFAMGCTFEQSDCDNEESPLHQVSLSSYHISKYEITQAQWKAVMGTTIEQQAAKARDSRMAGVGDNYPVYYVSWTEAKEFCDKLSEKTGKKYALPTEAQWEFAARGGNKSKGYKHSGSNTLDDVAWYYDNSNGTTHTIGAKTPNELGIYDMSGNVLEWCADWYGAYSSDAVTNPTGPYSGNGRVFRGGNWRYPDDVCRVSYRNGSGPGSRGYILGFRVVCLDTNYDPTIVVADTNGVTYSETISDINFDMEMVGVQGGTFDMGATAEQDGIFVDDNEKPVHKVTLSSYYIGKYEITQAQYKAIMDTNPSYYKGDNLPVDNVTWLKAKEFCEKLSAKTGKKYVLPTEAQWEYAARGGNRKNGYKYSGGNDPDVVAWNANNSENKPHAVGTKSQNELGIYDMSGNVLEWCADWYGSYSSADATNPQGPSSGSERVARGGSWVLHDTFCRVSYRESMTPDHCGFDYGFRVVCLP